MKYLYVLLFTSLMNFGQELIGEEIYGDFLNTSFGSSTGSTVSLSKDGSIVAIQSLNDDNGQPSGLVRVYKNISNSWKQIGQDISGSIGSISLSADGNIIAISYLVSFENNYSWQLRLFKFVSGIWTQIGSDILPEQQYNSYSAGSISLSDDGNIVAFGSTSLSIYENIEGKWSKIGNDIRTNFRMGHPGSDSMVSLSGDGQTVAMGTESNIDTDLGSYVRVYKNIQGNWEQVGQEFSGARYDLTGKSISLSANGNIIAIGSPGVNNYFGQVKIYENILGNWKQIGQSINGNIQYGQTGGDLSLSDDGTIVVISTPDKTSSYDGSNTPEFYIYKYISGSWTQIGRKIGVSNGFRDSCSISLSGNGKTLAVGAPGNGDNGYASGMVLVLSLSSALSSDNFVLSNFSIYPNPTSEILNISLENNLQLDKVNIYNQLGQLVKTEKSTTINVQDLVKGSYYFEVFTDKGKATKAIIIK